MPWLVTKALQAGGEVCEGEAVPGEGQRLVQQPGVLQLHLSLSQGEPAVNQRSGLERISLNVNTAH